MLQELLINQKVNPKLISRMLNGLTYEAERSMTAEILLAAKLSNLITFDARICCKKKILAFVGPRGAGKSTAIAKLATRLRETFQLKIGLLSCEASRLGDGFHLKTFAELMGLPYACNTDSSFIDESAGIDRAIAKLADCEVVLLDTNGKPAIPQIVNASIETIMVLPAPWRSEELILTAKRYQNTGYTRLLISKLDKCGFAGPLTEALLEISKPLAFFSFGPRVPQDLEPASARRLANMLTQILH